MNVKSLGVVSALILIMFMSAIETSIISLALPSIKDDLGVQGNIALIFAVYFIAIVVANPIVGELLERVKIVYLTLFGLLVFMLGSLFSGMSMSFEMLILSRALQGFGAGVLMALSQIVPKLAFPIPLRYKVMGIVGSVWGISSLIGPLIGGGILEISTWHWLFFINIPIAMIAGVIVLFTFHFNEAAVTEKVKLDYKGLALFYVFVGLLVFSVTYTAHLYWNIVTLVAAIIVAFLMYNVERKVHKPFVPINQFTKPITRVFMTDFLYALILMGLNLYIPLYLQEVHGLSPLQSGFVILPMSLAWMFMSFVLDKLETRMTRKALYIFAFFLLTLCCIVIFVASAKPIFIAASLILSGLSFGIVYTKNSVIVQEETAVSQMKRMMSFYTLTKSLGNAVGSSVAGLIYAAPLIFVTFPIQNTMIFSIIILIMLFILWSLKGKQQVEG